MSTNDVTKLDDPNYIYWEGAGYYAQYGTSVKCWCIVNWEGGVDELRQYYPVPFFETEEQFYKEE